MSTETNGESPHIVVLGAGFGGLTFCQKFKNLRARITVVDRTNHHLFQPLLYQVATAGLSAPEIAQPIRGILSSAARLSVLMDRACGIDLAAKEVILLRTRLKYDYLVLAVGGVTAYFGHPEWEEFAPGLKTLEDAIRLRRTVLMAFERAEAELDPVEQQRLMTLIVVGGGPTGVELAGAFADLIHTILCKDFDRIEPSRARIILIESSPTVLSHMPPDLAQSATAQLRALGVDVRLSTKLKNLSLGRAELENGEVILAENIIWTAGVAASPITKTLGVGLDRAGRVKVNPDLSVPGHPEVFAIGDIASVMRENGRPVPGVSPAAMQMGRHVAQIIDDDIESPGVATRPAFHYFDKGTLATIGRSAAVADFGRFHFTGWIAWLGWLFVHLIFLVGFRNKIAVLLQWGYSYLAYKRGARIIQTPLPDQCQDPAQRGLSKK